MHPMLVLAAKSAAFGDKQSTTEVIRLVRDIRCGAIFVHMNKLDLLVLSSQQIDLLYHWAIGLYFLFNILAAFSIAGFVCFPCVDIWNLSIPCFQKFSEKIQRKGFRFKRPSKPISS